MPTKAVGNTVGSARVRALWAWCALAAGFVVAERGAEWGWDLRTAAWFGACCACLCGAGIARERRIVGVLLVLGTVAVGAGWYQVRIQRQTPDSLGRLVEEGPATVVTVRGVVIGDVRHADRPGSGMARFQIWVPSTRFEVAVDEVLTSRGQWVRASGKLWVRVDGRDAGAATPGRRVDLTGLFSGLAGPTNPGEADIRPWAAQEGFAGTLSLSGPALISEAPDSKGWAAGAGRLLIRWRAEAQARARDVIRRASNGDDQARGLLAGLLLGDYEPGQREVYDAFARQGLVHVLSISGFHLSTLALIALGVIRVTGDRGWIEPAAVAGVVCVYTWMVPASSPVMRSTAMVLLIMAAEALGRRYDRVTLLIWIGAALLVWRPRDLWSMGYQLSLGLTLALFWLVPGVKERMFRAPLRGTLRRTRWWEMPLEWGREAVATNVVCWLLATPLVMWRMGVVSPLAFGVSLLVTPLVMVVLGLGYVTLVIGMCVPAGAGAAAALLSVLAAGVVGLVRLVDGWAWSSVYVPPVPWWWACGATLLLIVAMRVKVRGPGARPKVAGAAVGLMVAWTGIEFGVPRELARGSALRIDTLDVGNGTCHVLRSGDEAMLWDCGSLSVTGVQARIVQAARALGVWKTPVVVVTHPDIDHFGGVLEVARALGVKRVLVPRRFVEDAREHPKGAAAAAVAGLKRLGIEVEVTMAGSVLELGIVQVEFVSPPRGAEWKSDNDHSLMGLVRAGDCKEAMALFTGDVEDAAITRARMELAGVRPLVMELPHHGSAREAAIAWTRELEPRVVLQSTGVKRANDPRWAEVRQGRDWRCTATDGAVWAEVTAAGDVRSGRSR